MKLTTLLLSLSCLGNAGLAGFLYLPEAQRGPTQEPAQKSLASPPAYTPPRGALIAPDKYQALLSALRDKDAATLRTLLEAEGLPDQAKRLARSLVEYKYVELFKALAEKQKSEPQAYWKNIHHRDPAEMELYQAKEKEMEALGLVDKNRHYVYREYRYNSLPEARRMILSKISEDYHKLEQEIRASAGGFLVKSDEDKLKLRSSERKKELEEMLTPDERESIELRTSQTSYRVKDEFGELINTEDEYKALYRLTKNLQSQLEKEGISQREQLSLQNEYDAQVAGILGEERMVAQTKNQDYDHQLLKSASKRFNLPSDTAQRVMEVRNNIAHLSQQIADSTDKTAEEKKTALQDLRKQARTQLEPYLKGEIGDAFARKSTWMDILGDGNSLSIDRYGRVTRYRLPGSQH